MKNAIAVRDHKIPKGSALYKSELELAEAMVDEFEAFYRQGCVLDRIRVNKEFRDANYTSFDEYLNERQPLGIKRTHGWQLIKAKTIRPLLPELSAKNSATAESATWTEWTIRPLTNNAFSPSDVKRLGKKIATQVRNGETLSASLVKEMCDTDRGVDRTKAKKKEKSLMETQTPAEVLAGMREEVELWLMSLEKVPATFWEDATADDSGSIKNLISSLSGLASFLRS